MILRVIALSAALMVLPACATAQMPPPEATTPAFETSSQPSPADYDIPAANEFCITQMIRLQDGSLAGRHQFFTLVRETGRGADPVFREALAAYGQGQVPAEARMVEVVEAIANPVTRQVSPAITVAQAAHLIRFARECETELDGQIAALEALDPSLANGLYLQSMGEDAMFLRSTLLDALYRLAADSDPQHGAAIAAYQRDLVAQRGDVEFAAFDAEIDQIEAMVTGDLEKRLEMSNQQVAESGDAGAVASAQASAEILTASQREQSRTRIAEILRQMMWDDGSISVGFP
ncbi:MAG: hypothetical protein MRY64_09505 [Hyphomonadaceae bacterium]|nr:hypothetical protein [Hyphomonadaceae bacterium]